MTKTVVLDGGHGVHTAGKRTPAGEREWTFNNAVLLAAKARLEQHGVKVVRTDDPTGERDVPLKERTNKANSAKADVLASIHHNALRGAWGDHTGAETYTYTGNQPKSTELAKAVQPKLAKAMGLRDRGIKQANLHMVRESNMPAILTEGGYMDSNIDIKAMRDHNKLCEAGNAIAEGILEYLGIQTKAETPKPEPVKNTAPTAKPKPQAKSINQMAQEVIAGKHGQGHENRRKSLNISANEYEKVRAEVNRLSGVKVTPPAPTKTIDQMAKEVIDGKHGNGHDNRRKSLGINQSKYDKVSARVNQLAKGVSASSKSIDQMAREVVAGKHGQGHANRQKSLKVDNATYQKVRARVNQLA